MTASRKIKSWKEYGAIALAISAPVAFFASIPWLKEQPDGTVYLVSGIAAFVVIASSTYLSAAGQAKMDEVERAGSRFAYLWGGLLGASLIALLLAVPPFQDVIYRLVGAFRHDGEATMDRQSVMLAFTLGFCCVVMAQSISTLLVGGVWRLWMARG